MKWPSRHERQAYRDARDALADWNDAALAAGCHEETDEYLRLNDEAARTWDASWGQLWGGDR